MPEAPGEIRATYQSSDYAQMVMMPVSLARQLLPGTLAFAIHELVQRRMETSIFDRIYRHDETCTLADFTYDNVQDCYLCPPGNVLKRAARRHPIGHHLDRRYEASEADCTVCPLREQCVQTAETRRKPLAVWVENAKEIWSQQMIAKIDTPEARKIYGVRRAMVEPVFGHMRSQKRLDRFTWCGKIKVNIPWMLYCMAHNIETIVNDGLAV
jgi:DDE family transposase